MVRIRALRDLCIVRCTFITRIKSEQSNVSFTLIVMMKSRTNYDIYFLIIKERVQTEADTFSFT